jgi:hypothetical protein
MVQEFHKFINGLPRNKTIRLPAARVQGKVARNRAGQLSPKPQTINPGGINTTHPNRTARMKPECRNGKWGRSGNEQRE